MVTVKNAYSKTLEALKGKRFLFVPFLAFAALEFVTLIVIYLAPRMPLKLLLGPPIRTIWGEKFLHYPINFLLIPKLTSLARMGLTVAVGSLLTGIAISLLYDSYKGSKISLKTSFSTAAKKYISLFVIVLAFTMLFYAAEKLTAKLLIKYFLAGHAKLLFLGPKVWLGPILICLNFMLAILIQSAFVYAIPILMIENEKLIKSILKSFILFKKFFRQTIILVGLPMLAYIPIIILQSDSAFLINKLFPEAILLVSILALLVSSFVVDFTVTVSTAYLYLLNKEKAA